MASTSSSSSADTSGSVGSSNSNGTGSVNGDKSSDSAALLVGTIVALVIIFVAVLFVIRSRRRRLKPKLFSPSNVSAFQGVTSTTALGGSSNALGASTASTVMASPHPQLLQTFRLPQLSTKESDEVAIDIQDGRDNELPLETTTQTSHTTSLVSGRSVFSTTILGLRSSITSIAAFMPSRNSGVSAMDSSASTISIASTVQTANYANEVTPSEQRYTGDAWRDLSDTCWSIDPGSDSEAENEQLTLRSTSRVPAGMLVMYRNRLSTLSDDMEEGNTEKSIDVNSLDDSSRRRDREMSSLDDLSPRRERGISSFEDSSPQRVRGLSALERRREANSIANIDTNKSGLSFFSEDSDYFYETGRGFSSVLFDDSDSEIGSDSDDSLLEEEF